MGLLNLAVIPICNHNNTWCSFREIILPPSLQIEFIKVGVNLKNPEDNEGVFDGSRYSDIIETVTDYSLHEPYLTPEQVKDMHDSLSEEQRSCLQDFGICSSEDELKVQELEKFFRVCRTNMLGLVGYVTPE